MPQLRMYKVQVLVIFLAVLLRGIESLDFCFNASLEGSRLNSPILRKRNVSSKIECILSCVQEPCCRSLNYRERLPQGQASLCEMLHDVFYNTSSELEKNRFYDYVYFNEPQKEYNSSCVTDKGTNGDFDLNFPSESVQNYILLDNNVPEMSNMTLMFWINTVKAGKMTVLSYAVDESAGEFSVMVKREKIILRVQSLKTLYFLVPPINDGYWHHVGVSWSLGKYAIYLDGTLVYSGDGLGSAVPLKADGVFAIGQKLLSTNGTFESSFSGKLSQLNIWNDFVSTAGVDMKSISQSCSNTVGTIINWSALEDRTSGMVVKEQPSSCNPLRNNTEYDVIIAPSLIYHNVDIIISENIPSLEAFTITIWAKLRYVRYTRYVHYSNAAGTSLLSFYAVAEYLTLEIAGAPKKEARVPRYWYEYPAYWHHIATTWSSDTGHWKIYLDGSLVSIMHGVASGITIPAGGQLSLGLEGYWRYYSSQSRLNIWDYEVDGHVLSLMANKGPLFENGNVFAWYGIKSKIMGDMNFQETPSDLYNSRSGSVYQMDFPEASTRNYAMIKNVFPHTITFFSACFWAKFLKIECAIFTYSTLSHEDEIGAYLYSNHALDLGIKGDWTNEGPKISAHESWHFYCMQWKSTNGLIETYQDGKKLESKYKAKGYTIPSSGIVVLGQELDSYGAGFASSRAFKGSLAGLNFWRHFLTANVVQGMASGVMNVNGNLLQWRDFRDHVFGDVTIQDRSEAEIPEYRVQNLRDKWCEKNITAFTYARFIRNQDTGYMWRCVTPTAMLDENMCYNISKYSADHYTREEELLGIE